MTDMTQPENFLSDERYERFAIKWGLWAALSVCAADDVKTVLDIGSGRGEHARLMRHFGKEVFTNDWKTTSDYPGDIMNIDFDRQFDAVLCSHVLEHQRNVGAFLDKLVSLVRDDGVIALAVPAHSQHAFVAGHLSVWSLRLLAYNLMQAGVDCSRAHGLFDNECSFIVRKKMIDRGMFAEKSWAEHNARSGAAQNDTTTLPWHDDLEIIRNYLPFKDGSPESPETNAMNWPAFLFPEPVNTKDIQILTGKQPEPVTMQYAALRDAARQRAQA